MWPEPSRVDRQSLSDGPSLTLILRPEAHVDTYAAKPYRTVAVKQAAAELGLHEVTVRRHIAAGDLRAVRLGPNARSVSAATPSPPSSSPTATRRRRHEEARRRRQAGHARNRHKHHAVRARNAEALIDPRVRQAFDAAVSRRTEAQPPLRWGGRTSTGAIGGGALNSGQSELGKSRHLRAPIHVLRSHQAASSDRLII